MRRHIDRGLVIKSTPYWNLLLHPQQQLLGHAVIIPGDAGQPGSNRYDLNRPQRGGLERIEELYTTALQNLWQPDAVHEFWFGDEPDLGALHLIPRYRRQERYAFGHTFTDQFGQVYDPNLQLPGSLDRILLEQIRECLAASIYDIDAQSRKRALA